MNSKLILIDAICFTLVLCVGCGQKVTSEHTEKVDKIETNSQTTDSQKMTLEEEITKVSNANNFSEWRDFVKEHHYEGSSPEDFLFARRAYIKAVTDYLADSVAFADDSNRVAEELSFRTIVSTDGLYKIYIVDTYLGGTMSIYDEFIQYKDSKGKTRSRIFSDTIPWSDDPEGGVAFNCGFCIGLYPFQYKGKKLYTEVTFYQFAMCSYGYSLGVCGIEDGKRVAYPDFIPENKQLHWSTDYCRDFGFKFDAATITAHYNYYPVDSIETFVRKTWKMPIPIPK